MDGEDTESVPKYAERLATRFWAGLWPVALAVLLVLVVWQALHLVGAASAAAGASPAIADQHSLISTS